MTMSRPPRLKARPGIALVVVIMFFMAVAAVASGAAFLGMNTTLIAKYHARLSTLESVADAGLEQARAALNGKQITYPDSGYTTYENGVAVTDVSGAAIPGVRRWLYVGPSGITSGQYGVFGSVVAVVTDQSGNRIVRRLEVKQESFAKFSYFTDIEGNIVFGANDVLYGPVHTNDTIRIGTGSPGATFYGQVRTAKRILNRSNGNYNAGYQENASDIDFPTTAELTKLQSQATIGGTAFTAANPSPNAAGRATMRIEFIALDLNGDGDTMDEDEGFMKIYKVTTASNAWFVVADTTGDYDSNGLQNSRNCAHTKPSGTGSHSHYKTFYRHSGTSWTTQDQKGYAVRNGTRYCFLGGDDRLNDNINTTNNPYNTFRVTEGSTVAGSDDHGLGAWQSWVAAGGTVDSRVATLRPRDKDFLWPISRALNPNFKGVIHVTGKVAISGTVRGKITLAATDNIIIVDNLKYATTPGGTTPCDAVERDILGLFSGKDIIMANNLLNSPWTQSNGTSGIVVDGTYRTWAESGKDEYVHAVILALSNFTADAHDRGPTDVEDCGSANNARGCLFLTGGIIQVERGPVGITDGRGYTKRYQYDQCAATNPPPYFPTTGWFNRGHYYEVEPTNFSIATYWPLLVPGV